MSRTPIVVAHGIDSHDDLSFDPILPEWILEGTPIARSKGLAATPDNRSFSALWDCSAGRFTWKFGMDETVHILEGEVTVSCPSGKRTTLVAGDVAYFPAGTTSEWHVQTYVKKLAFLRDKPRPLRRLVRRFPFARAAHRLASKLRPAVIAGVPIAIGMREVYEQMVLG